MWTWSWPAGTIHYSFKTELGLNLTIQIPAISSAHFSKGLQCQYCRQERAIAERHLCRRSEDCKSCFLFMIEMSSSYCCIVWFSPVPLRSHYLTSPQMLLQLSSELGWCLQIQTGSQHAGNLVRFQYCTWTTRTTKKIVRKKCGVIMTLLYKN